MRACDHRGAGMSSTATTCPACARVERASGANLRAWTTTARVFAIVMALATGTLTGFAIWLTDSLDVGALFEVVAIVSAASALGYLAVAVWARTASALACGAVLSAILAVPFVPVPLVFVPLLLVAILFAVVANRIDRTRRAPS